MQRRFTIASIIILTLLLITAIAFATVKDIIVEQTVDDYTDVIAPSVPLWQVFKIPQKCKIEVVELWLEKSTNISGFTLGFYYWNGTALGNKIYEQNFTSIPTLYTKTNYTLSNPVQLNSSAYTYALYIKAYGGTENDYLGEKISIDNPYSAGSLWVENLDKDPWDLWFILYGELLPDPSAIIYQWLPVIIVIAMMGIAFSMLEKLSK